MLPPEYRGPDVFAASTTDDEAIEVSRRRKLEAASDCRVDENLSRQSDSAAVPQAKCNGRREVPSCAFPCDDNSVR